MDAKRGETDLVITPDLESSIMTINSLSLNGGLQLICDGESEDER